MLTYVCLGLLAISIIFVLSYAIMGLVKGIKKTIGVLAAIISAAIISAILTLIICSPTIGIMTAIMDAVKGLMASGALSELFSIAAVNEVLNYYGAMIAAPFVFLVIYGIFSIATSIVARIIVKRVPPHEQPRPVVHKLGGVGVGVVCGLLAALITLMPVVGCLNILVSFGQEGVMGTDEATIALFDGADDNGLYQFYSVTNGWMFDSFASTTYKGQRVYLRGDMDILASLVGNIGKLAGNSSGYTAAEVEAFHTVVNKVDESPLLKNATAGLVSTMATKWMAGETFMGMGKIEMGALLNPTFDSIFTVLSTSDSTNIVSDLATFADMLGVFVEHDMLSDPDNYDSMLDKLAKQGVVTELTTISNHNPRMITLSDEIAKLSVRALALSIGMPETPNERHDNLMNEIALIMNDSRSLSDVERYAYVEDEVARALDAYGVSVTGEASRDIAASLIGDLGAVEGLDGEDIKEFFMIYSVANGNYGLSASGYDYLASNGSAVVKNSDGTISIGDRVLQNYTAESYKNSYAYQMGKGGVDIGGAARLYSAEAMESSIVILPDILAKLKTYNECVDPDGEAVSLSNVLVASIDMLDCKVDGEINKAKFMREMGDMLEIMSATELFGQRVTDDMLKAIFQNEDMRDELGMSVAELDNFTKKMSETAKMENSSYLSTSMSVSYTIDVMDKLKDDSESRLERVEATKILIADMSAPKAELMATMTIPSMMIKYGASEDRADIVADSMATLFSKMAIHKPEGQAQYDVEARAVNALLQLAMNGSNSDGSLFDTLDEGGKTGTTAVEFVDLLMSSEIVDATLTKTIYEDGNTDNPYGVTPGTSDTAELSVAINAYYDLHKDNGDEQLTMKLNAIAIVAGLSPVFPIN